MLGADTSPFCHQAVTASMISVLMELPAPETI